MKFKHFIEKKTTSYIIFILIFICISIYYNNHIYLFYRPQSTHAWRQADCASITLNYYQTGMNFFKPQVHNLTSDNGQTGYCSPSEIPVLYYFSAFLYKIFGANEIIIRIINTLIFFLGLLYLYKTILNLFKDNFWAIAFSIVFYTSPVLIYYGNNYLTNVSALSFAIMGLFFFTKYNIEQNKKFLLLSLLFFLLGGIFKVTALMTFFAVLAYYIYEKIKFFRSKNKIIIKHNKIFIIGSIIILSIVGGWISYTACFNKCHECFYFSTTIFPVWDMNSVEIKNLIDRVREYWLADYFHISVHILFLLMLIFILIKFKKANFIYAILLLVLIFQSIIYISLQFWTFYNHDYYTINQNIVPIFISIVFLDIVFKKHTKVVKNILVKIVFSLFILFNIYHAKNKLSERYTTWKNNYKINNEAIYSISPYLREIGINFSDRVIYFPDKSNVSLYLMNQYGWTQYTDAKFNRDETIKYNQDSIGISKSINSGAKYLIINNFDILYEYPYLQSFTTNLIGKYKNVLIFNLVDTVTNFIVPHREITDTIICYAEQVTTDMFITSNRLYLLENGNTQSNKKAFEGIFSSMLTKDSPYGMTAKIYDCKFGEGFYINVWRYGNQKATIVTSGPSETKFYITGSKIIEIDTISGWEKLEFDFSIPKNMVDKELKIYLFNPTSDTVHFDNLIIERYNKPMLIQ